MKNIETERENRRLKAALEYKNRFRFSVIPVDKQKEPLIKWGKFQRIRASDEEIRRWFRNWPDANIGIVTGNVSDLLVIDMDKKEATKDVLSVLPDSFKAPMARTPRGGRHFYFRYDARMRTVVGIIPGIDIRAEGGYILAPPSVGSTGARYKWLEKPSDTEIPPMPQKLLDLLVACQSERRAKREPNDGFLTQGRRDDDLFHTALELARAGVGRAEIEARILHLAATAKPPFDRKEALIKVESAFKRLKKMGSQSASPVLRTLSEIAPRRVGWLWRDRIPRGKLTVIAGDPDVGKSILSIFIAARVTTGSGWPDTEDTTRPKSVILLTAEDGLADTVRLRADAAGADASKIKILDGVRTPTGRETSFSLESHIEVLEKAIREITDVDLIIIDPISAYLGRTQDRNTELRSLIFSPLTKLAERYNVTILAITHYNKNLDAKSLQRIIGSTAYAAAPRSVWGIFKISRGEEPDRRLFVPLKANLSKNPSALAFSITEDRKRRPKVVFDPTPISLDALRDYIVGKEEGISALEEAMEMLRELLKNGRVESSIVLEKARQQGISEMTLRRAKDALGVKSRKGKSQDGFKWFYELPPLGRK